MDCVICDKCRLNGKVQTRGLATALKVLLLPERNQKEVIESMQHQEIVSLIQLFAKLSESLTILDEIASEETKQEKTKAIMSKIVAGFISLFFAASLAYAIFDLETPEAQTDSEATAQVTDEKDKTTASKGSKNQAPITKK